MNISALAIEGARLITVQRTEDERGHFVRLWCRDTLARAGIDMSVAQASGSFNRQAGTVRGMHFAWPPAREAKLVRCARGRVHDVLIDLRPPSPTYRQSLCLTLDAQTQDAVYVPAGVAHGFQTLVDDTELHYMMSEAYRPELLGGVRFDDPAFGLRWPLPVRAISPRDRDWPHFDADAHARRMALAVQGAPDAA